MGAVVAASRAAAAPTSAAGANCGGSALRACGAATRITMMKAASADLNDVARGVMRALHKTVSTSYQLPAPAVSHLSVATFTRAARSGAGAETES